MYKYFTVALFSMFAFASCEKNIEVKTPPYQPLLVINSANEVHKNIEVKLGKSISILNYNGKQDLSVTDATVKLYTNGAYTETLKPVVTPGGIAYVSNTITDYGNTYMLGISAPGFPDAEATSVIPARVPFDMVRTINSRTGHQGSPQDELKFTINEPASDSDFYLIKLLDAYSMDTTDSVVHYYNSGCLYSSDPSIKSLSDYSFGENDCISTEELFISDELFNGKRKELKLFIDSYWPFSYTNLMGYTFYAKIKLYHITPSYFKYLKSYQYVSDNNGNPFAEPINVYTNIKNGYGVFTISSSETLEFR